MNPTISMSHTEFLALVTPVMPMVSQSSIGALEGVRIRTVKDQVIAEGVSATMMGLCTRPLKGAAPGFDIVFPITDIPAKGPAVFETIGLEQTTTASVIVEWSGGGTALVEYDVLDPAVFPDVPAKLRKALTVPARGDHAYLSPTQLRAFAVAGDPANNHTQAPVVVHTAAGSNDMVLVTCGRHFAGLAAPAPITRSQPRGKLYIPETPVTDPIKLWRSQLGIPEKGE